MSTPAALQIPLVTFRAFLTSLREQASLMQALESEMNFSFEHEQWKSVKKQPVFGSAEAKQVRAQSGMSAMDWAAIGSVMASANARIRTKVAVRAIMVLAVYG